MAIHIRRRDFIFTLGGAALRLPLRSKASGCGGSASFRAASTPAIRTRRPTSRRSSRDWSNWAGSSAATRIDYRWGLGNAGNIRKYAEELAALAPDVILASGNSTMPSLLQATRTVPIVFVNVADPVGSGFVDSLARPGGNATGFVQFEYNLSGKWLELLKEIAPGAASAVARSIPCTRQRSSASARARHTGPTSSASR